MDCLTDSQQKEYDTLRAKEKKQRQILLVEEELMKQKSSQKSSSYLIDRYTQSVAYHKSKLEKFQDEYKKMLEAQEAELKNAEMRLENELSKLTKKSKVYIRAEKELEDILAQQQKFFPQLYSPVPPTPAAPAAPEPKKVNIKKDDSDSESEDYDSENDDAPPILSEPPPQPPLTQSRSASRPRQSKPVESDSEDDKQSAMKAFFSDDSFRMAPAQRHFAPQYDVDRPRVIQNTKKMPKRAISLSHNR